MTASTLTRGRPIRAPRPAGTRSSPAWSALAAPAESARAGVDDIPWESRDLVRATWVVGVGAVALSGCWYGASGTAVFNDQVAWIIGGVGCLAVAVCGLVSWLLSGLRAVRRERRIILVALAAVHRQASEATQLGGVREASASSTIDLVSLDLVTAAGMSRYHRPSCLLMRGKAPVIVDPAAFGVGGLSGCGVCGS